MSTHRETPSTHFLGLQLAASASKGGLNSAAGYLGAGVLTGKAVAGTSSSSTSRDVQKWRNSAASSNGVTPEQPAGDSPPTPRPSAVSGQNSDRLNHTLTDYYKDHGSELVSSLEQWGDTLPEDVEASHLALHYDNLVTFYQELKEGDPSTMKFRSRSLILQRRLKAGQNDNSAFRNEIGEAITTLEKLIIDHRSSDSS